LEEAVERYHAALLDLVKGDSGPATQMFSQRDDVVLWNPFRPFAIGQREVVETIEQAASHFANGECEFQRLTVFATDELAYMVEIERFRAKLDGKDGSGALRVTTVFRVEEDGWRVAHRHADPITTPQPIESILQK